MTPNVAIVFKPPGSGGAARYVAQLARWFDATVYVLGDVDSARRSAIWDGVEISGFGSRSGLPLVGRRGIGPFLDRLEYGFWQPPEDADVVISSGLVAKESVHHPHQARIHLAHGFHRGAFGVPVRDQFSSKRTVSFLQKANRLLLRQLESAALSRVDVLVANSEFTADMVEFYFGVEPRTVIPPPVDVDSYSPTGGGDYYLYLGNLAEYKGVGTIVDAFDDLEFPLVVAGDGDLREELERTASGNVTFEGYVTEDRKRELLGNCRGLIQNSVNETFGVTTVEALASGTPVVAVGNENNPYLVDDGENGVLFESDGSSAPLEAAVRRAESIDWNPEAIRQSAQPFDAARCKRRWEDLLDDVT